MAAFMAKRNGIEVAPAQESRRKGIFYYRFYSNKSELYWSFYYEPTERNLNDICKALKLPNYEEVDENEFQKH